MNIDTAWLLLPIALTAIFFFIASRYEFKSGQALAFDIEGLIRYGAATIASLVVWFVYAAVT